MTAFVVLALLLVQDPDPVEKFRADLDRRLKEYPTFTIAAMADALQFTTGSAGKSGVPILEAGAEVVSKTILTMETKPTELRKALGYIEKARKRAAELTGEDEKRAALTYGLQRALAVYQLEADSSTSLANLGLSCLSNAAYAEAEDALKEVEQRLPALRCARPELTPMAVRVTPILLARVDLARGRFAESAAALKRGIDGFPEWADWMDKQQIEAAALSVKEGEYARILKPLEEHVSKKPDDMDALLLRAHEMFFSADRKKSTALFEKILKAEPKNKYAQYFLDRMPED